MFLEDKLNNIFEKYPNQDNSIDYLNCMIAHISEQLDSASMSYENCYAVIKQTDTTWRQFAKKKGFTNPEFFRHNYINHSSVF